MVVYNYYKYIKIDLLNKKLSIFNYIGLLIRALKYTDDYLWTSFRVGIVEMQVIEDEFIVIKMKFPYTVNWKSFEKVLSFHLKGIARYMHEHNDELWTHTIGRKVLNYTVIPKPESWDLPTNRKEVIQNGCGD
jgi:hypothetical protein